MAFIIGSRSSSMRKVSAMTMDIAIMSGMNTGPADYEPVRDGQMVAEAEPTP